MNLIRLRFRAEMRTRWRATLLLVVVVGLGGGVALTAIAGARRSEAAMPAFLASTRPDDGGVLFGPDPNHPPAMTDAQAHSLAPLPVEQAVLGLPQVAGWYRQTYLFLSPTPSGQTTGNLNPFAPGIGLVRQIEDQSRNAVFLARELPGADQDSDEQLDVRRSRSAERRLKKHAVHRGARP